MQRRSFLGALFGGGAAAAVSTASVAAVKRNPLEGQTNAWVRVDRPLKAGARLFCQALPDGIVEAWPAQAGEKAHAIAQMDADFGYKGEIPTGLIPPYQTVAVRVLK